MVIAIFQGGCEKYNKMMNEKQIARAQYQIHPQEIIVIIPMLKKVIALYIAVSVSFRDHG